MSDGLLERLRNGCILRQRRWSIGVCEGWPVDEAATDALMAEAADEIERLRKDAERYRWLRCPESKPAKVIDKLVCESPSGTGILEYRAGDELDDAIDAAMALTPNAEITGDNEGSTCTGTY